MFPFFALQLKIGSRKTNISQIPPVCVLCVCFSRVIGLYCVPEM